MNSHVEMVQHHSPYGLRSLRKSRVPQIRRLLSLLVSIAFWFLSVLLGFSSMYRSFALATERDQNGPQKLDDAVSPLELGNPIQRELGTGDHQTYSLTLKGGQYVQVVAEPKGIDLAIEAFRTDGAPILKVVSPYGSQSPVFLSFIADSDGSYVLSVHATEEAASAGHYTIRVEQIRQASPQDKKAIEAEELVSKSQFLVEQERVDSKRSALEELEKARFLSYQAGDREGEAQALDQLGALQNDLGENNKALESLKQSLQIFQAVGDRRGEAGALCDLGSLHNDLGENQLALSELERSLAIREQIEDARGKADTLELIGTVYENLSETAKALDSYARALSLRKAISDRRGEAQTLGDTGVVYYDLDEDQKALEYYNQGLSLQEKVHDTLGQAETLNNIAVVYDELGDRQKALEYFGKSLALKQAVGNRHAEGTALNNMCHAELTLASWQSALEYCNSALTIRQIIGDRLGESSTLNNIGMLYDALGDQQKALSYFRRALDEARAAENRMWEGTVLSNIGLVSYENGDYRQAIAFYSESLSIKRAVGDRHGQAATLNNMARAHDVMGDKQQALQMFTEALQIARDSESRQWEAAVLGNMGRLYAYSGDGRKALDYLDQALPLFRSLGDERGEASALYGIARADRDLENLDAALTQIEAALEIIETLRTRVTDAQMRASYFSSVREYYDFYIDLLMQLHQQHPLSGYDAKALAASESSKARSLVESLGEARSEIREGVDPQLLERERSLQKLLDGKTERRMALLARKHTEEQAASREKEIEEILSALETLEGEIRASSPRYAALVHSQPLTLQQIQRDVVDKDSILLEYALGEQHSYVWAVTPVSLNAYELPKRAEIEAAAAKVYSGLTAQEAPTSQKMPGAEQYSASLSSLADILLGAVDSLLQGKRLVIVSDGVLQYIPFGVLPSPTGPRPQHEYDLSQHPLMVDHEIISLPSASTLVALRSEAEHRGVAPKAVAVFADPVFERDDPRVGKRPPPSKTGLTKAPRSGEGDAPLPGSLSKESLSRSAAEVGFEKGQLHFPRLAFSRIEANSIMAVVPPGFGVEALDFHASKAAVTSGSLSQYRILHFATHGLLDSEHPQLSGLVLSLVDKQGNFENGFLQLQDIYNLNVSADLVVLSACKTALGKEIKGEGLVGLTRGFMYAGAPRVVASLWDVDDVATAELMKRFYKSMLIQGERPGAALRQAQMEMQQQKRWRSPYYWGAFVLLGDWN